MDIYGILLTLQYASITLLLFMCTYIIKRWKNPLHGWLFFYCMAALVNNASYLGVMQAKSLLEVVPVWKVAYLGRVWIPFSLLQFVLILCRKKRREWLLNLLALMHALTYVLVLFLEHNTLYYTSFSFVSEGLFPHVVHGNGIWHYIHDGLVVSYIVYGLTNLFWLLKKTKAARRRKQLLCIITAIVMDCCFFVMELFHVLPGYDMTAMGYTLATIPLYLAIFPFDMLGTEELAREVVLDRMEEGVIVVDEEGNVTDYNQKAGRLLPILSENPGQALVDLQALTAEKKTLDFEGRRYTPKENILTKEGHAAGMVYMLSDDTAHYAHAQ